jgi:hypothetical protein
MPEIAEAQALMKHLAVKAIRARNGTAALTRTPVLPEETSVGALPAQLRRSWPRSATGAKRTHGIAGISTSPPAPQRQQLKEALNRLLEIALI